jgi:hypothetical protein
LGTLFSNIFVDIR